jgi:hypothetical protein
MGINQKDIKLLWGRSGNRCAICKTELTQDENTIKSSFTLGEQAHIVGEKAGATRGQSTLGMDKRNSYHNLILLCPNHHTTIDKNEADWPVEKLHQIKSEHELWVTETLSETVDHVKLAENTIIASVVDSAVKLCYLETWSHWTYAAVQSNAYWDNKLVENIYEFKQKVLTIIWPKNYSELSFATITLAILLDEAIDIFVEHNDFDVESNRLIEVKFYIRPDYNPNYERDLKLYREWKSRCYQSIQKATKAANWFADAVRNDVNPMFFAERGRFSGGYEDYNDFNSSIKVLTFTEEEKQGYIRKFGVE